MKVKFSSRGTTLISSITGELDHHWADYLKTKLDAEIYKSRTKDVIFDFGRVSFMDSSGIGVLLGRFKNVVGLNGRMAVVNVNEHIQKIFEMSGLMRVIPVYDSVDTAIQKMQEV